MRYRWLWWRSRWPLLAISKVRSWWWARRRRRELLKEAIGLYGEDEMRRSRAVWQGLSTGEQVNVLAFRRWQLQVGLADELVMRRRLGMPAE